MALRPTQHPIKLAMGHLAAWGKEVSELSNKWSQIP